MTDGINLLVENTCAPPSAFMPLLALALSCLIPLVVLLVHHTTRVAHPSVWSFLVVYDLVREHFRGRPLPLRPELILGHLPVIPEYDDPPVFTAWKRPDPLLDGAEDPVA